MKFAFYIIFYLTAIKYITIFSSVENKPFKWSKILSATVSETVQEILQQSQKTIPVWLHKQYKTSRDILPKTDELSFFLKSQPVFAGYLI